MATQRYLSVRSPAKVNHFLHIVGQRADGYHLLQTCFQFITLADEMHFQATNDGQIMLHFPGALARENNLIFHAAMALKQLPQASSNAGCVIHVDKQIPLGGGLGGGSSNAATTLLALNYLWQLGLSNQQLQSIGLSLGADVPIFVYGQAAFAEGIGEQFTPLPALPEDWLIIVTPPVQVNTKTVFNHPGLPCTPQIKPHQYQLGMGHNDCEIISRQLYPAIDKTFHWLNQYAQAQLTGTGATVFARVENEQAARKIAAVAPKSLATVVTHGINLSPIHRAIDELTLNP